MIDRFECFCGAGWFTKDELVEHVQKEHPEMKELPICECCDRAFKNWGEAKDHVLSAHDVYCDECQDHYIYDGFNKVWWFTVEQDIGIAARTEEEAERKFRNKYGDKTILGIIRPESLASDKERIDP